MAASSRMVAALVLTSIGTALSAISLVGPWWGATVVAAGVPSSGAGFYSTDLWKIESAVVKVGNQSVPTGSWDSMQSSPLSGVHRTARILAFVSVAVAAVAAALCGLAVAKKVKPRLAGAVALVMGFLMLIAPIYFAATVGPAWQQHASGVQPEDSISSFMGFSFIAGPYSATMSWGPGAGWWVLMIGAILSLIGAAVAMGKEKAETPPPGARGQPPAPATPTGTPVAVGTLAPAAPAPVAVAAPVPYAMPYPPPYAVAAPAPACPTCGSAARFVFEYQKWYCDRCASYPWG